MKSFNRILFSYVIGVCFLIIFTFSFMIPVSATNTIQTMESKENVSELADLNESQEIENLDKIHHNEQEKMETTNSVKIDDEKVQAPVYPIEIDEDPINSQSKPAPKGMHRTTKGQVVSSVPNSELDMSEKQSDFNVMSKFFSPFSARATYSGDPYVKNWEIRKDSTTIKDGDTMYYNETYTLTYDWELPNNVFSEGDVLIFTIPPEFVVDDLFDFNVFDPDGDLVGRAKVRGNNESGYRIEMTLTDYIESNSFVEGKFELKFHLNETYVKEGTNVVELPGHDLTVNFPPPPETGEEGGGDGSGKTDYGKLDKEGQIQTDSEVGKYIAWNIVLGRDALLGRKDSNGVITPVFDSFDDVAHVYIKDEPKNQRLIPVDTLGYNNVYGINKTFWKSHPFTYTSTPKNVMGLIGTEPDYYSFESDIIDTLRARDNEYQDEGFTYFEFWYYTEPLDRFDDTELDNEATVTVVGKNGEEIEYVLTDSVQWNTGSGEAGGKKGSVELEKYDDQTHERLEDAVFSLYKRNPNGSDQLINYNLVTNSDGKIVISGLTAGDYYFVETTPPPGYELSDKEWEFSITRDNINEGQYVQIDIPNTHIADRDFDLIKRDEATGFTIGSGAVFELERYDAPNWVSANNETYTTDSNGRISLDESDFEKLESPAWYRFKEIKAPYGYEMPNDPYTDSFYVDNYSVEPKEINKTNRRLDHKMSLQKSAEFNTSTNSPTRVDGIEFVLQGRTNGDWNRFTQEVFITDSNGMIKIDNQSHEGLIDAMVDSPYEQFRFREYSIPPGRGLQNPEYPNSDTENTGNPGDKFSVEIPIQEFRNGTNNGQSVTLQPLKLENKLIRYDMSFTKMDSVNKDRLNGAEFTMTEKGKPGTAVTSKGNNGVFDFQDLIINREYEIEETKAPEGYGARSDIYVIRLDLDEKMHVARRNEKGQTVDLVEGTDFTWNDGQLKLNFAVENTAMPKIPMTGGIGMTIYGMVGTLLMGIGFILYKYIENTNKRSE